jgi:hypothetical protein
MLVGINQFVIDSKTCFDILQLQMIFFLLHIWKIFKITQINKKFFAGPWYSDSKENKWGQTRRKSVENERCLLKNKIGF